MKISGISASSIDCSRISIVCILEAVVISSLTSLRTRLVQSVTSFISILRSLGCEMVCDIFKHGRVPDTRCGVVFLVGCPKSCKAAFFAVTHSGRYGYLPYI